MARCLSYTRYIEDKYLRKVAVWQLEPARSRALSILVAAVAWDGLGAGEAALQ